MISITCKQKQSGVVLVISLIMLLLLTIIGVTAMQVTGLEEKMAGNNKDKNVAFQAAEAALRDSEQDIKSSRVSGLTSMDASCTNGLCYNSGTTFLHIETQPLLIANAVSYGDYSTAPDLIGIPAAQQPRYLIVGMKIRRFGETWKYQYKVTALAQGGQSTTQSILQEVYAP